MRQEENIGRAKLLLEMQPVGKVYPAEFMLWATKVLCFLLQRYIKGN